MKTILIAAVSEGFGSREAVSVVCVRKVEAVFARYGLLLLFA